AMWAMAVLALAGCIWLGRWRRSPHKCFDFLGLGLVTLYARLWHGCFYFRPSTIPAIGPAILITNHTSSADAALLAGAINRPVGFLLAREYYNIPVIRRLFEYIGCVAVVRNGRDVSGLRAALRRVQEGRVLAIFPEGGLSNAGRRRMRP